MLRFAVYDDAGPARALPLVNAYLLGPGDVPIPGAIKFKDGHVVCRPKTAQTAGLCLQWDAGAMGCIMLQTCLLPDRDRPYDLVIELARHRIKMFIAKSEEWQMFDLGPEHRAVRQWEEVRGLFSKALIVEDPVEASRISSAALIGAVEATERLALAHAEILLHWRFGNRPASSRTLGVRVHPRRDTSALREIVKRDFDLLVLPVAWNELEIEEGRFDWDPLDRWVTWASREKIPIVLGPLLDFSKTTLPKWMYVWQHDYSTCRDLVYEQVEQVVHRYRNSVAIWNIASGLNVNDNFQFTAEQMLDLARMANLIARQARKGSRTMLELVQPFGEHCAVNHQSVPPVTFMDRVIQEGIRVDCIGLQLLFGQKDSGRSSRDLMQISDIIDRYLVLDMPVVISAFGVPSRQVDEDGGFWHKPWSSDAQSRWMSRVFAMAMSKPFVETLIWTDLYDHDGSILPAGGLVSDSGHPKPVLKRLVDTRRRLRKPLGRLKSRLQLSAARPDG
ncbi:MAG: endo-1,4-beta-xylanase [Planctomycetes bacterium]|nr:endo-1,4-beta-xylanase [Planctomycetota bacterium]